MAKAILTHVIALNPTPVQEALFRKACGVARFAYNWGLSLWNDRYNSGHNSNEYLIDKAFNNIKHIKFPWIAGVSRSIARGAFRSLKYGFEMFFGKINRRPLFKKKGVCRDSFCIDIDGTQPGFDGKRVRLPRIGWVKMRKALRFKGKPLSLRIIRKADKWFLVVPVRLDENQIQPVTRERERITGIDLGVKTAIVTAGGHTKDSPMALEANLKKLRRLQRQHSKKVKGSNNRRKSAMKLAKLHLRIANIRQDWLHKTTTTLVKHYKVLVIEDLDVNEMLKNGSTSLSRKIADIGFGAFRQMLTYKSQLYGCVLIVADRFFASSKTCSSCGFKLKELSLSTRNWVCSNCQEPHDRDVNAAKNLRNYGIQKYRKICGNLCLPDMVSVRRAG